MGSIPFVRSVVVEDLTHAGGERLGMAGVAELATHETAVVARETVNF